MKIDRYDNFFFDNEGLIRDRLLKKDIIKFDFSESEGEKGRECLQACLDILNNEQDVGNPLMLSDLIIELSKEDLPVNVLIGEKYYEIDDFYFDKEIHEYILKVKNGREYKTRAEISKMPRVIFNE